MRGRRPIEARAGLGLAVAFLTACGPAWAQLPRPAERTIERDVAAVRLSTLPEIDGDLSDPVWKEASRAERWVDWLNGNTQIDQTVVFAGYDDENLYLGWYAYDSKPQEIVARQTKRGAFPDGDDWIDLNLDPYHTHKFSDFSFFYLNPRGTKYARLAGGRATKLEWEGDWQAAARIVSDGWTAEMAIPWSILNYPATKGPTTIGINFLRYHKRLNMISNWSNIGPNDQHPEYTGHMTEVELPPFRPQYSLLPYAAPGWREEFGGGLRSGVDARARLTPTLSLVGTVNPDFESVEGAVEGIDFSYGERFVPDRRPFFQEGSNIYGVGSNFLGSTYHSGRIGEFDTGVNLYGKVSPKDTVGVLATLDFGRRADWVLRARRELGTTSKIGLALVNRDDDQVTNRVLHVDEDFRTGNWNIDTNWVTSWVGGRQTGDAANLFLSFQSTRWFGKIEPHFVRPGFRDDLGFIPFTDFKGVNTSIEHNLEWRRGPLRFLSTGINTRDSHHYDGTLFRQQRELYFNVTSRSDYSLRLGWDTGRFEEFDDNVYSVSLGTRVSDPFHNYGIGYSWGRRAGDPITFITPYVTWRFGEKFTIGVASALLFHTEDAEQHVVTFNYDLSPEHGIGGRMVAQTGGTNAYLAFRHSGYGGVERFVILGDPNATKFRKRIMTKVVWPF